MLKYGISMDRPVLLFQGDLLVFGFSIDLILVDMLVSVGMWSTPNTCCLEDHHAPSLTSILCWKYVIVYARLTCCHTMHIKLRCVTLPVLLKD